MARSFWFEAYLTDESSLWSIQKEKSKNTIEGYRKALSYQQDMPHAWLQMASLYGVHLGQLDSAEHYASLAVESVPNWIRIYRWMGNVYSRKSAQSQSSSKENKQEYLEKGRIWLEKGLTIAPDDAFLLNELAYNFNLQHRYPDEQRILDRAFALTHWPLPCCSRLTVFQDGANMKKLNKPI